jgi:hypothetical protein
VRRVGRAALVPSTSPSDGSHTNAPHYHITFIRDLAVFLHDHDLSHRCSTSMPDCLAMLLSVSGSPIPGYQSVMLPLLQFAGDRLEHSPRETIDVLAEPQYALLWGRDLGALPDDVQRSGYTRTGLLRRRPSCIEPSAATAGMVTARTRTSTAVRMGVDMGPSLTMPPAVCRPLLRRRDGAVCHARQRRPSSDLAERDSK